MNEYTTEKIKSLLGRQFSEQLIGKGIHPEKMPDNLDLLADGIIDSLGIMEMISAIETEYNVQIDFENLPVEQLTVVGPFSTYVAGELSKSSKTPF